MSGTPWAAYLCLSASMLLVGSYVGLSKLLLGVFPVFLLALLRFGIAALAMLPWLRREVDAPALSRRDRQLLFWQSFLGNFLFSIFMLYGVMQSSAVAAGVVMAAIPAAVALLSRLWLHERISPRVAAAIACAAAGIALLALARHGGDDAGAPRAANQTLGHALLLLAAFCEASYVVIGKRLTGQVSPRRVSALINLWGLALIAPIGLWQAASFRFADVAAGSWALVVFYALAASVATVWLWMRGLQRVQASRAGVFTVLLPIASALMGVAVLGESFGPPHAIAFALALAGLLLVTWPASGTALRARSARA
jgi:drug/metabolite transporter (DMT)-like permease